MTQPPYNPNQPQQPQGFYQGPPQYQGEQQPGHTYPGHPQQLYTGAPGSYPGGPVPPQRSWFARHTVLTVLGSVFAFFFVLIIIGIAVGDPAPSNTSSDTVSTTASKTADAKPAEKNSTKPAAPAEEKETKKPAPKPAPEKELTQADKFKAFINENGTPAEKAAAEHIIKVQGAEEENDIFDTADVYTDYAGGLMGPHQGDGKLLASAFADWKDSENGLVTIYDKDGELLSNGNY
ncbi:hypothetical protein ACFWFI_04400 [Streptomyces sp. NPDC060209]|uniref:hypothetical protein n=1 Tax=Streptomyces sp. NPDC060209 TaxID=3347073 RepID=UPI003669D424